jgi:competence protein ComEC
MQGSLGNIHWTVLEPEPGGAESEDSNDGSIAMRWDASDYTLYTMADLPEKGQMRLAENHLGWLAPRPNVPVILKVSHHGSADQYPELIEYQHPAVALISVGAGNPYGHPTQRTLNWLAADGASVFRTDLLGGLSVAFDAQHRPTVLGGG